MAPKSQHPLALAVAETGYSCFFANSNPPRASAKVYFLVKGCEPPYGYYVCLYESQRN
jgi:hypothetical protein